MTAPAIATVKQQTERPTGNAVRLLGTYRSASSTYKALESHAVRERIQRIPERGSDGKREALVVVEHRRELEPAAQRLDIGPQGRELGVIAVLEARHARLADPEGGGQFLLGDVARARRSSSSWYAKISSIASTRWRRTRSRRSGSARIGSLRSLKLRVFAISDQSFLTELP